MHCERIDLGNGKFVIACFSGHRKETPKCAWCGKPATALCDGKPLDPSSKRKTCDKPMCDDHRYKLDGNHDLCPPHQARWTGEEVIVNGVTLRP